MTTVQLTTKLGASRTAVNIVPNIQPMPSTEPAESGHRPQTLLLMLFGDYLLDRELCVFSGSVIEVCDRLGGVSRQRADKITRRRGFPEPLADLGQGRIWDAGEVSRWIAKHRAPAVDDTAEE